MFMARSDPAVSCGCIAMNLIQRKTLSLGLNQPVPVTAWFPPSDYVHLTRLGVEVDFAAHKKTVDPIDAELLGQQVTKMFRSQVFCMGQEVLMTYFGHNFALRVIEVEVRKGAVSETDLKDGNVSAAPFGILGENTTVMAFKGNQSAVNLVNFQRSTCSKMFRPHYSFRKAGNVVDCEIFRPVFASRVLAKSKPRTR